MPKTQLTERESLCDLRIVKAEYGARRRDGRASDHCFRLELVSGDQDVTFDVVEPEGELFAAELDALAAIIRSRVIHARMRGDETDNG